MGPPERASATAHRKEGSVFVDEEVRIPLGEVGLEGRLCLPRRECGVVVFAHGSGSGRHSPRNRHVAAVLRIVAAR